MARQLPTARLRVAWDYDLELSDLAPMGDPEFTRDVQRPGQAERQVGLHVIGSSGISLGLVVMRCGRSGEKITPWTLSIPDQPVRVEPLHSNPRRTVDADDGA